MFVYHCDCGEVFELETAIDYHGKHKHMVRCPECLEWLDEVKDSGFGKEQYEGI